MDVRPNIVFFQVDNIGLGELGCYGAGEMRGANTKRIDSFAIHALKLTHYIVEAQCTPTRSALLTGRYAVRSGTHTVNWTGKQGGLVAWERTLGDILSAAGYVAACIGKWHVGAENGRWPTDHGFDEFYGPAHSYDPCLWPDDPWYDPKRDPVAYMYEGRNGHRVEPRLDQQLTRELRRDVDKEYERRAFDFMRRAIARRRPFFLYHNHSMLHFPTIPRKEFIGKSRNGAFADCLLELDHDFGSLLDELERLGVAEDTIVIFAGDNGPEDHILYRGTAGFFEGSYFTSSEGGIRTPCLIRWPGRVVGGRESNEMVHVTDIFSTLITWAGCTIPDDRIIDGVDQRAFFEGRRDESARDGCLVFVGDTLHGVKWKDFKFLSCQQRYFFDLAAPLGAPRLINLITDPKEREPINYEHGHSWVLTHVSKQLAEFHKSLEREAVIPTDAPIHYVPGSTSHTA